MLARDPSKVRELEGAEAVRGDLRDPVSLEKAVAGCSVVAIQAADAAMRSRPPRAAVSM